MLEGLLVTIILGYVFGYIALKIIHAIWDRPATPKQRDGWRKNIEEEQDKWLNSAEFQRLNRERLNKLQPEQQRQHTES